MEKEASCLQPCGTQDDKSFMEEEERMGHYPYWLDTILYQSSLSMWIWVTAFCLLGIMVLESEHWVKGKQIQVPQDAKSVDSTEREQTDRQLCVANANIIFHYPHESSFC